MSDSSPTDANAIPSLPPGQATAAESPRPQNAVELDDATWACVFDLIRQLRQPDMQARRLGVKNWKQLRSYYRGDQHIWWNDELGTWFLESDTRPIEQQIFGVDAQAVQDAPYQTTYNIVLAYGVSIIGAVGNGEPQTRFFPANPKIPADTTTAKEASAIVDLVDANNPRKALVRRLTYFQLMDGGAFAYTRYVADGQRFGYSEQPQMGTMTQPVGVEPDTYPCPGCGFPNQPPPGLVEAGAEAGQAPTCESCGKYELAPEMKMEGAQIMAEVPVQTGSIPIANGQELHDAYGRLEVRVQFGMNQLHETSYLELDTEVHTAKLRAAFPKMADRIPTSKTSSGGDTAYERYTRLALVSPAGGIGGVITSDFPTYSRVWLRPEAFFHVAVPDDIRNALVQKCPRGLYVGYVGDVGLEARHESMDDHWAYAAAYPGEGQGSPAVLAPLVELQDEINDMRSIRMETIMRGIPPTLYDPQVISPDYMMNRSAQPGIKIPGANVSSAHPLSEAIHTPQAPLVSPDVQEFIKVATTEDAQLLSGAYPAAIGADTGDNDTAHGIAIQRDAALGRLGIIWSAIKDIYSKADRNAVEAFRANRTDDVYMAIMGEGTADFEMKVIKQANLSGSIMARAEEDDGYPVTGLQKRNMFMNALTIPALAQAMLSNPEVWTVGKRWIGMDDVDFPGEDARRKQLREIAWMKANRQAVPVDPVLEDNPVEFAACQEWANSDDGMAAKLEDPALYQWVMQHAMAHKIAEQGQAMVQAQGAGAVHAAGMAAAGPPPAPPGGPGPTGALPPPEAPPQ